MKLITLLMALSLVSCGKSGGGKSCSPTKALMSTWTSRSTGNVFNMSGCTIGSVCTVKFGPGACDDNRGDFLMYVNSSGRAIMGNCGATQELDRASYKLSCSNVLSLKYDSNGVTEIFD